MILYNNAKLFGTQPSALQAHTDAMDGCKAAFHLRHIITHLSTPTTAGPASELISIMALNEASTLQSFQNARTDFHLNVDQHQDSTNRDTTIEVYVGKHISMC